MMASAIPATVWSFSPLPDGFTLAHYTRVLGDSSVYSLDASNTIFFGAVQAARRQIGCIRFSYVTSRRTPRRYRCQPDLALAALARASGREVDELTPAERSAVAARLIAVSMASFSFWPLSTTSSRRRS